MNTSRLSGLMAIAAAFSLSACTVSKTPAPLLQGPSEQGLALVITASPDTLSMDGASQSRITIEARDSNGQPQPNVSLRIEIRANGTLVDFGSLSARTVVTDSNGRAFVTYTAPVSSGGAIPTLNIVVTPAGTDTNSAFGTGISKFISIRLVPPGVITGGGPTARFTVTPQSPEALVDARFDASASTTSLSASIASYSWDFGDGSSATGVTAQHQFSFSGTYHVVLTVRDTNGLANSTSIDVSVVSTLGPTPKFTSSPADPHPGTVISFNGGDSTAAPGTVITIYEWDFGDPTSASNTGTGLTITHSYVSPGTYVVRLTVRDSVGRTKTTTSTVAVL